MKSYLIQEFGRYSKRPKSLNLDKKTKRTLLLPVKGRVTYTGRNKISSQHSVKDIRSVRRFWKCSLLSKLGG